MPYRIAKEQRDYQRQWMADRRAEWFLQNGPCVDCESWDCLRVDHVDATTPVSRQIWGFSEERRKAELQQCVVRCESCHRAKTRRPPQDHARGEHIASSKLTEADVRVIRASPESLRVLARKFGVNRSTIQQVRKGKSWRHVQ
jgi:5-methylcytosine-specific restriction endonuclease McrA